ncbi:ABC transporter permease [Alkaliphilus transvaalensis]|uniref:ABC transporter permease n=1 Tax=Alkaliphilus transvaalensis TaxID=114628 RepID=UPI001FA7878E|nr:ABC transporter permease [Alkaliphilus transvaalensis]
MLNQGFIKDQVGFLLTGFIVTIMIGAFISMLSLRVSNLMEAEVLELYSTIIVNKTQLIIALVLNYLVLSIPQIIIAGILAVVYSTQVNVLKFIFSIILAGIFFASIGVFIGLVIKNKYKASGIVPYINIIFLVITPIYYRLDNMNRYFVYLYSINPIVHILNIMRESIGIKGLNSGITLSYGYIIILCAFLLKSIYKKVNNIYILEKLI